MLSYKEPGELGGLYHVGTRDISRKSNQSHEWNGLSVSNCPDAWRQICGCCGDTWKAVPKGDARLLSFYDLDERDLDGIRDWAVSRGYFERADEYRVLWLDDECGDERFFVFAERYEAESELEDLIAEEREGARMEARAGLRATPALERMSLTALDPAFFTDIAVMLYAEEQLGACGVWFEEVLDPWALSAPRGVIFNSRVDDFEWERS